MSPAPDERDRIRCAMDRILAEAPEHSNAALTIVALSVKTHVPRNSVVTGEPAAEDRTGHATGWLRSPATGNPPSVG